MTDDQHGEGTPRSGGRWDPLPQGDYDDGATAFVKLPEGGIDALLASDSPLAAPGHGYVPPQITPTAEDGQGATGIWAVPADGSQWPDPNAVPQSTGDDRFAYNPGTTQQWTYEEPQPPEGPSAPAPGHDVTGQWSIPVADGDLPDESGEFTTSSLVQQWGGTPPATLPGGAPAPWATEAAGRPWGQPQPQPGTPGAEDGTGRAHEAGTVSGQAHESASGTGIAPGQRHEPTAGTGIASGRAHESASGTGIAPGQRHEPTAGSGTVPGQAHGTEAGQGHAPHAGTGHGPRAGNGQDSGTGHDAHDGTGYGSRPGVGRPDEPQADAPHTHVQDAGRTPGTTRAYEQPGLRSGVRPDARTPEHLDAAAHAPVETDRREYEPGAPRAHDGEQPPAGYAGQPHAAGDANRLHETGNGDRLHETGNAGRLHETGNAGRLHETGNADQFPAAGDAEQLHAAGSADQLHASEHTPQPYAAEHAPSSPALPRTGPRADDYDATATASRAAHGAGEAARAARAAEGAHGAAEAAEGAVEAFAEAAGDVDAVAGPAGTRGAGASAGASNRPGATRASARPDSDGAQDSADGTHASDGTPHPTDAPHTTDEPHASDAPTDTPVEASPQPPGEEHPLASYVLRVNGVERPVSDAWIGESLLYVLRERLGLAGAKDGCSQGECGACNVQVDGRLVASCLVPAATAAGSEVRTVEGLAEDGQPSDVQRALATCGAVQCGFCVPGMAMTVHDLLEGNPAPTELETRQALCGNLCRCSGYRGVVEAVKEVVAERDAHSGAEAERHGDEARIPHQAGPGAGGVNPSAFESPAAHDQAYGQDGGQA